MEKSISDMEASLIVRVNTVSKEFQTEINTVLQERVDEESIAAKTFDKI
jgi:ribosome-associated toxin RatA of RatAB toxin-antitoxin module